MSATLQILLRTLITASHILHYHDVLDAYGHVSVRSPDNNATFWMPSNISPALVSSVNDLVEYRVEDSSPVEPNPPAGYIERYIHSEIYKRFPTINSVVHSHSGEVLPYAITNVPLRPTLHTSGFLGNPVPLWAISAAYTNQTNNDLLVRDQSLGASLSEQFGGCSSCGPSEQVVLMQSHGFTTVADSIEKAVFQAYYTQEAAMVLTRGLSITDDDGDIRVLTEDEANDSWVSLQGTIDRPWGLWTREVEVNPLYVNDAR